MIGAGLSAVAIDLAARDVTLVRHAPGAYVGGRFVDGPATTSTIRAAHQPATARDLQDLPEGERVDAQRAVWTRTMLLGADEAAGRRADSLIIEGETWRVVRVWPRTEAGFWKAIVGKLDARQRGL